MLNKKFPDRVNLLYAVLLCTIYIHLNLAQQTLRMFVHYWVNIVDGGLTLNYEMTLKCEY